MLLLIWGLNLSLTPCLDNLELKRRILLQCAMQMRLQRLNSQLSHAISVGMRLTTSAVLLGLFLLGCDPTSNTDLRAVELARSGARAGVASPKARIEIDSLSTDDRIALEGLVMSADVPNQPAMYASTGSPSAARYQLTVQYTNHSQMIVFHDDDQHPQSLDRLAAWIEAHR